MRPCWVDMAQQQVHRGPGACAIPGPALRALAAGARRPQHHQLYLKSSAWAHSGRISPAVYWFLQMALLSTMIMILQCSTMPLPYLALLVEVQLHAGARW